MKKLVEFGKKAMFYVRVLSGYEERCIRTYRLEIEKRIAENKCDATQMEGQDVGLFYRRHGHAKKAMYDSDCERYLILNRLAMRLHPTKLWCDNEGTLHVASSRVFHYENN